jgi:hypothetical protein
MNIFYKGTYKLKLSNLILVKRKHDEIVLDFIKRFKDTKNWCLIWHFLKKDITNLSFVGLCFNIKEKLEQFEFLSINQLLQKVER